MNSHTGKVSLGAALAFLAWATLSLGHSPFLMLAAAICATVAALRCRGMSLVLSIGIAVVSATAAYVEIRNDRSAKERAAEAIRKANELKQNETQNIQK